MHLGRVSGQRIPAVKSACKEQTLFGPFKNCVRTPDFKINSISSISTNLGIILKLIPMIKFYLEIVLLALYPKGPTCFSSVRIPSTIDLVLTNQSKC